jgi:hypothetical protein
LFTSVNKSPVRTPQPDNATYFSCLRRFFGRLWRDKST